MKNNLFIILLIGAFLMGSCGKDFLETEPTEFVSKQAIDDAAEDRPLVAVGTLAGLYSLLYTVESGGTEGADDFGHKGYDLFTDLLTGDMILAGYNYGWYQEIAEYQTTTDFTYTDNYQIWRFYYSIIYGANNIIAGLGGNEATLENTEDQFVMGQAKALRAFAYFYLANYYGEGYQPSEPLVPVYTEPLDEAQPLSTAEEVYDQIISDLETAVVLLEGFDRTDLTQINQPVAKGLLAYSYAAVGEYEEVKVLTQEIINSGEFVLGSPEVIVYSGENLEEAGFNDVSAPGWMWGVNLTLDSNLDLHSWWGQVDLFTYSYAWAGDAKAISYDLYDAIPAHDIRRGQFVEAYEDGILYPINKFYAPERVVGGQRDIETDYVYMRLAEMYLLLAEAAYFTGDEATAKDALKTLLRERLEDTDEDGELIAELNYLEALSGESLLEEIFLQTRIELWGEGKTYLAIERLERSITLPPNHLSLPGVTLESDSDELSFEIPQNERQNNPNISL